MTDDKISRRTTNASSSKGQITTQQYTGQTVKTTTTNAVGEIETRLMPNETIDKTSNAQGSVDISEENDVITNRIASAQGSSEISAENDVTTNKTARSGAIRETRTSTGVGERTQQYEDKGVVLRFRIPIQQKNPITRQSLT